MMGLGKVRPGSTIRIPFGSYAAATGASSATTNYVAGDIQIYKNGSTTQRSSSSGITVTADFDALTGINFLTIDLADNTVADFYSAGAEYIVVVADVTIDGQTVRFPIARFLIGVDGAQVETTINTLSSQTSFTLVTGPAEDNALVGCTVYLHDTSSAVQCAYGYITAYTGSTRTVTLAAAPTYTIATSDNVSVFPRVGLHNLAGTALTARDLGASVLLSSGTGTGQVQLASGVVQADVRQFNGTNATASGGRPEVNMTHIAGATVSASTAQLGVNVVNAAGTAWGSGAITGASLAADAGAEIADAVWDEAISGHLGAGSTGAALNAAGSAGDPWTTPLPGAYGSGTAGNIVGTRLDAAVTTRLAPTVAGRTLDVSVAGEAGMDWANIGSPTTSQALSGTTISTSQSITSVSGSVGSVTGSVGSVAGNVGGNVVGSVGSVTGAVGSVTGNVSGNVVGSTASVTAGVTVTTNNDKTGYALTSGERNSVADALLDRADAIETGSTPRGAFRLMLAALAGKLSGAATTTVAIRNLPDTKTRITATVDSNGNRTAISTDQT